MLTACRQSFSGGASFGRTASAKARNVKKNPPTLKASAGKGGEGGIRTRDTVSSIHTFQACSFNHSDTSPEMRNGAQRNQ
jgi:hypothetical protein